MDCRAKTLELHLADLPKLVLSSAWTIKTKMNCLFAKFFLATYLLFSLPPSLSLTLSTVSYLPSFEITLIKE